MTIWTYSFADFRHVAVRKEIEVGLKTRIVDRLPVSLLVEGPSESDVVSDGGILNPGALRAVCNRAFEPNGTGSAAHLTDHTLK